MRGKICRGMSVDAQVGTWPSGTMGFDSGIEIREHFQVSDHFDRRVFSTRLIAVLSGLGSAGTAFSGTTSPGPIRSPEDDEISHSAEAIHLEVAFNANPKRVYETLLDAEQFDKVTQLGEAVRLGLSLGTKPTQISKEVGGSFVLFGGHGAGLQTELTRVVGTPRVAGLAYPFGRCLGMPGDVERQRAVVGTALKALQVIDRPGGAVQLPFVWPERPAKAPPPIAKLLQQKPWLLLKFIRGETAD